MTSEIGLQDAPLCFHRVLERYTATDGPSCCARPGGRVSKPAKKKRRGPECVEWLLRVWEWSLRWQVGWTQPGRG